MLRTTSLGLLLLVTCNREAVSQSRPGDVAETQPTEKPATVVAEQPTIPVPAEQNSVFFPEGPEFNPQTADTSRKGLSPQTSAGLTIDSSNRHIFHVADLTTSLSVTEQETWQLKFPKRIKQLLSFNEHCVAVRTVQSDPTSLSVQMMRAGTSTIQVACEDQAKYLLRIRIAAGDNGLSLYLRRLYPERQIDVYPIQKSVLLTGAVVDAQQRGQIVDIAQKFFPHVLDHLSELPETFQEKIQNDSRAVDATYAQWAGKAKLAWEARQSSRIVIDETDTSLFLVEGQTYSIACPENIKAVEGFDAAAIYIQPIPADTSEVTVTARRGKTKLTLQGVTQKYTLDIIVESDVADLTAIANRLYPDTVLLFVPINNSVVVRGVVATDGQAQQIVEIAEQYFSNVLNQMTVVTAVGQLPKMQRRADLASVATSTNRPPVPVKPPVGGPSAPAIPASLPANTHDAEMDSVRSDIKALHKDVRDLIELLQKRSAGLSAPATDREAPVPQPLSGPSQTKPAQLPSRQLIYFRADYCQPCQKLDQQIRSISAVDSDFREALTQVDIENDPDAVRRHRVDRIPTIVVLEGQTEVTRVVGLVSEDQLRRLLKTTASAANATPAELTRRSFLARYEEGIWLVPVVAKDSNDLAYLNLVTQFADTNAAVSLGQPLPSALAKSFGVDRYPALLLLKDGEVVNTLIGPTTNRQLQKFAAQHETYLSRRSVPLAEQSIVVIRQIREDGTLIDPVQHDVGAIIASEPGRSIVAIPWGAVPSAKHTGVRMLVCLFPGTINEQTVGADLLYDPRATAAAEGTDPSESELPPAGFGCALLEISHPTALSVCPLAEVDPDQLAASPVQPGQPFAIFRPRSLNERRYQPVAPVTSAAKQRRQEFSVESAPAIWNSVLCDLQPGNQTADGNGFHVDLHFLGGWLALTSEGKLIGFGSSDGGERPTPIYLSQMLDFFIGAVAVEKQDRLLKSAASPKVIKVFSALAKREALAAALSTTLGLTIDKPDELTRRRLPNTYDGCLVVRDVVAGSAAFQAGLRAGDCLLGFNGYEITTPENLAFAVARAADSNDGHATAVIQRDAAILRTDFPGLSFDAAVLDALNRAYEYQGVLPRQLR